MSMNGYHNMIQESRGGESRRTSTLRLRADGRLLGARTGRNAMPREKVLPKVRESRGTRTIILSHSPAPMKGYSSSQD